MSAVWAERTHTGPDPGALGNEDAADALRRGGAGVRWVMAAESGPSGGAASTLPPSEAKFPADGPVAGDAGPPLPIEEATARALSRDAGQALAAGSARHAAAEPVPEPDPAVAAPPHGAPVSSAVAPPTIDALHHRLGAAARAAGDGASQLDRADVEATVSAAVAHSARYRGGGADDVAARAGDAVAAMAELDLLEHVRGPVSWAGFGPLIPVLSGSPGAGASVVAAALSDALQRAGRCTLLVDAADPARSGLAAAASAEGPWTHAPHRDLTVRFSWRESALLARLESGLPMVTPGMVPPPPAWLPDLDPLHATVVDIGHDGWRATANPLVGAGGWLRFGAPAPRPVLVVRPTRPSLRHAEQVLSRLDLWVSAGMAVAPFVMVVTGAKRWPAGVVGAAGHRLTRLIEDAVFLPHDPQVEVSGVTDALLPDRLLDAVTPLLAQWGLIAPVGRPARKNPRNQGRP